jgi:hypothetical protein
MSVLEMEYRETAPVKWRTTNPTAVAVQRPRRPSLVSIPLPTPAWQSAVEERFAKLTRYEAGWDGYNASVPRASVIIFARDILMSVMKASTPAPAIVPLSSGGLQLEWHVGGLDVELTIYRPYEAELSAEFSDGQPPIEELPLSTNFSALSGLLGELV